MTSRDVLGDLLAASPAPAAARAAHDEVVAQTQAAYDALFSTPQVLPAATLHAFAAIVARWQGSAPVAEWHVAQGADPALLGDELPGDPRLRLLVEHLDVVTVAPALGDHEDQHVLAVGGITPDEIVLVSQLVAATSHAIRVLAGYAAIDGRAIPAVAAPVRTPHTRGRAKDLGGRTIGGEAKPIAYTQEQLRWIPWVAAPAEAELTTEQVASFAAKATTNSVYFRLLSRVPAVLLARSALDNAVFLGAEGLPRAERELAAAVASKVNDCIYCASVHARKATFQSKRASDVDRLLAAELSRDADWQPTDLGPLSAGQDERWAAVIDAAAHLSTLRPSLAPSHVERLRAAGVDDASIGGLVDATAFFAWANRLMLTLGEPAWPAEASVAA